MFEAHFLLTVNLFLVVVQEFHQEICMMIPDYFRHLDFRWFYINWQNCKPFFMLFVSALQRFATCSLNNNKLSGKLASSLELPILFDDSLKITSVLYFVVDFNSLSYELNSFTFKLLYWVVLYQFYSITKLNSLQNSYISFWKI